MKRLRLVIAGLALLALSPFDAGRSLLAQEADLVIVNGRVMDPASGLVVAPGFVDILAHLRPSHEPQRYKIKDGVTTVIRMHGGPVDIRGWYGAFETDGALVNYGTAVGHPNVRDAAGATNDYRPATSDQQRSMREIATRAIRDGAVGVGFGINYTPGASYEEVVDLFDVAARQGVPAHVHSRYKGSVFPETIVQSVQEVIATIVTFFIPEDEVLMGLEHPLMMITADGVIVNGTVVLDAGEFVSGATPGRPILSKWRDNYQRTP